MGELGGVCPFSCFCSFSEFSIVRFTAIGPKKTSYDSQSVPYIFILIVLTSSHSAWCNFFVISPMWPYDCLFLHVIFGFEDILILWNFTFYIRTFLFAIVLIWYCESSADVLNLFKSDQSLHHIIYIYRWKSWAMQSYTFYCCQERWSQRNVLYFSSIRITGLIWLLFP